jgi:hypothetical protein
MFVLAVLLSLGSQLLQKLLAPKFILGGVRYLSFIYQPDFQ